MGQERSKSLPKSKLSKNNSFASPNLNNSFNSSIVNPQSIN